MNSPSPSSANALDIHKAFEVDGGRRWIGQLQGSAGNDTIELLIIENNTEYFALPLHCPHEQQSLAHMPLSSDGSIVCLRHGLKIELGNIEHGSFTLKKADQTFLLPTAVTEERIRKSLEFFETPPTTEENEIDALKSANQALEEQVLSSLEKMDVMLSQVESRKADIEQQATRLASLYELINGITNSVSELLIVTDANGLITRVNQHAEEILGCKAEELIGNPPDLIISEHDRSELQNQLKPSDWDKRPLLYRMTYQSTQFEKEVQLTPLRASVDSSRTRYLMRGTLLYSPAGKEEGMILIASDITEVIAKEDRLHQQALEQHLALMQATLSSIGQGIAVFDQDGRLSIWNSQYQTILNYPPQLMAKQTHFLQLLNIDRTLVSSREFPSLDSLFSARFHWSYEYRANNRYIELESFPMPDGGFAITAKDITRRRKQEERVRMLSHAVEQSPTEIVITDTEGKVVYANPMFTKNTGYSLDEAKGIKTSIVRSGEMPDSFYDNLWSTIKEGSSWRGEIINKKKSGETFWQFMAISPVRGDDGNVTHYLAVKEDISKQKEAEQKLQFQADHDLLTQLPNRVHFQRRVTEAIQFTQDNQTVSALLFLDLDNFKDVNDSLGHQAGDQLLQAIAKRLLGCIRSRDTAARLGGDEFAIIQNGIHSPEDVVELAMRIITALHQPFRLDNNLLHTGGSIGIAMIPTDGTTSESLLANADVAMYAAKNESGSTYRFYDLRMHAELQRRRTIEFNLRNAIALDELTLHYQPKIDIRSRKMVGVEALLRWTNETLGVVPPDEFIPVAEKTGLIASVGEWVFQSVISEILKWSAGSIKPIAIAVNLSPIQLRNPVFSEQLYKLLRRYQIPTEQLELEVTETAAMTDPAVTLPQLDSLSKMGIKLALDDFGTGYSSLSQLAKLPIDRVKIDRSFISEIEHSHEARAMVESIIRMSHVLNKQVIAEGVETGEQLRLLEELQCDEAQGYLISRPLPIDDLNAWITKQALPDCEQ